MSALVRALTYATVFAGVVLVFVPAKILEKAGVESPEQLGVVEWAGLLMVAAGGVLAVWCVVAFASVGRGTPAPFDPPRKLVIRGPYRYVRNPMYLGAILAMGGAALVHRSGHLMVYDGLFLVAAHVFVVRYEEPALDRLFGREYRDYRARVRRWVPTRREGVLRTTPR